MTHLKRYQRTQGIVSDQRAELLRLPLEARELSFQGLLRLLICHRLVCASGKHESYTSADLALKRRPALSPVFRQTRLSEWQRHAKSKSKQGGCYLRELQLQSTRCRW